MKKKRIVNSSISWYKMYSNWFNLLFGIIFYIGVLFLNFLPTIVLISLMIFGAFFLVMAFFRYNEERNHFETPKRFGANSPLERYLCYYFYLNWLIQLIVVLFSPLLVTIGYISSSYENRFGVTLAEKAGYVTATGFVAIMLFLITRTIKRLIINKLMKKDW
jgi:hypothetical protein